MILTKLNYRENEGKDTYWEINNLNFGMLNLIVGMNATGKTRLVNLISNLAKILSKKIQIYRDGCWDLEFKKSEKEKYKYKLKIEKREIVYEEIKKGNTILLKREYEKGKIYSFKSSKKISISPPKTELVVHVRRDVKEFPFLEDILEWANSFLGYKFTAARPNEILVLIGENQIGLLEDLGKTPYLLKKALKFEGIENSIIKDFSSIGYPINKINVKTLFVPGSPNPALITSVKENDLKCEIDQRSMSQGMFRALSLIVILNYLLKEKKQCTIVIDDLGEGLDFQRSSELTKLLVKKLEGTNIQMIMTSNDRFLINSVNYRNINLLERVGHIVETYNYQNNRKVFDEFKYTGLNNFDLFSGKMYKSEEK